MRRRNAIGSHSVVVLPSTHTSPDDGVNNRLMSLSVVVFPHPDSPSKTSVSPRSTLKFNSEIICRGGPPWPPVGREGDFIKKLTFLNWTSAFCASFWPIYSVGEQQVTAEAFLRVEPRARELKARLPSQLANPVHVVFVRVLRVNQLARRKLDLEIELLNAHALVEQTL